MTPNLRTLTETLGDIALAVVIGLAAAMALSGCSVETEPMDVDEAVRSCAQRDGWSSTRTERLPIGSNRRRVLTTCKDGASVDVFVDPKP